MISMSSMGKESTQDMAGDECGETTMTMNETATNGVAATPPAAATSQVNSTLDVLVQCANTSDVDNLSNDVNQNYLGSRTHKPLPSESREHARSSIDVYHPPDGPSMHEEPVIVRQHNRLRPRKTLQSSGSSNGTIISTVRNHDSIGPSLQGDKINNGKDSHSKVALARQESQQQSTISRPALAGYKRRRPQSQLGRVTFSDATILDRICWRTASNNTNHDGSDLTTTTLARQTNSKSAEIPLKKGMSTHAASTRQRYDAAEIVPSQRKRPPTSARDGNVHNLLASARHTASESSDNAVPSDRSSPVHNRLSTDAIDDHSVSLNGAEARPQKHFGEKDVPIFDTNDTIFLPGKNRPKAHFKRKNYAARTLPELKEFAKERYLALKSPPGKGKQPKSDNVGVFALQFNEISIATVAQWATGGQPRRHKSKAPLSEQHERLTLDSNYHLCSACSLYGHYAVECPSAPPTQISKKRRRIRNGSSGDTKNVVTTELCEGYLIEQRTAPLADEGITYKSTVGNQRNLENGRLNQNDREVEDVTCFDGVTISAYSASGLTDADDAESAQLEEGCLVAWLADNNTWTDNASSKTICAGIVEKLESRVAHVRILRRVEPERRNGSLHTNSIPQSPALSLIQVPNDQLYLVEGER